MLNSSLKKRDIVLSEAYRTRNYTLVPTQLVFFDYFQPFISYSKLCMSQSMQI